MLKRFRTWHAERAVAAALAVGLALVFGGSGWAPWLVALARVVGFSAVSIADRIAERAEVRLRWADKAGVPDNSHEVKCAHEMNASLVAGFIMWGVAQAATGAWDGMIWAAVIAGYRPAWRRLYRRWRPIEMSTVLDATGGWRPMVTAGLRDALSAADRRLEVAMKAEVALLDVREELDKAQMPDEDLSDAERVRALVQVTADYGIALAAAEARIAELDLARASTRAITMQDVSDAMWGPRVNDAARATGDDWDLSPSTMQAMADSLNARAGLVPRPCLHATSEPIELNASIMKALQAGVGTAALCCKVCGLTRAPLVIRLLTGQGIFEAHTQGMTAPRMWEELSDVEQGPWDVTAEVLNDTLRTVRPITGDDVEAAAPPWASGSPRVYFGEVAHALNVALGIVEGGVSNVTSDEGPLTERRPRLVTGEPDGADEGRGGSPHSARENAEHYARLGDRYAGPCDCGGRGVGLHGFHYPGGDGCLARRPRVGSVAEQGVG